MFIDPTFLQELEELGTLEEIIDVYLKHSPPQIQAIQNCASKKDLKGLAQWAHTLKSSSQALGATKLGDCCQRLEQLQKSNNVSTAILEALIAETNSVYQNSCQELIEIQKKKNA